MTMTQRTLLRARACGTSALTRRRSGVRAGVAVLLMAAWSCGSRAWSEVVVTELPQAKKPAEQRATTGTSPQAKDGNESKTATRDAAADYLAGLREAARRAEASANGRAELPNSDEVKLDLIPSRERKERFDLGYERLRVPSGTYGVEGHGTRCRVSLKNGKEVTPVELAGWIRNDARYTRDMTVYLLACETGKGDRPYAQELADLLQANVYAPTEKLWIHRGGAYSVHSGSGKKLANGIAQTSEAGDAGRPGVMKAFYPTQGK